jgi:hypothetical protein
MVAGLTYFYPPLNLLPLILLRPLRLFVSSERLRGARIALLKVTHFPFVAALVAYEGGYGWFSSAAGGNKTFNALSTPPGNTIVGGMRPSSLKRPGLESAHSLGRSFNLQAAAATEDAPLVGQASGKRPQSSNVDQRRTPTTAGLNGGQHVTPSSQLDDLRQLLEKLNAKVDDLADQLATQQPAQSTDARE